MSWQTNGARDDFPTQLIPNPEWQQMPVEERLMRLLSMSLDECYTILAMPINPRDSVGMNMKLNVVRAVLTTCVKLGIKGKQLEVERERIMAEINRKVS